MRSRLMVSGWLRKWVPLEPWLHQVEGAYNPAARGCDMGEQPSTPVPSPEASSPVAARIASEIPGRMRFHLIARRREDQPLFAAAARLERERGVRVVSANPLARSITVQYDSAVLPPEALPSVIAAAGIRVEPPQPGILARVRQRRAEGRTGRQGFWRVVDDILVIVAPFIQAPEGVGGDEGTAERGLTGAVQDLEDRIFLATGKRVRIATIGPLVVVGLGLVHIAVFGLMIETLPGILLVWIGLDTFVKLNPDLVYGPRLEQRVVDMLGLPDQERQIVTFVIRNEPATAGEIAARFGLEEAPLRAYLRKLVEDGYLAEVGEEGERRYRPASARRRASTLSDELWQKLDSGPSEAPPAPRRRRPSQVPESL